MSEELSRCGDRLGIGGLFRVFGWRLVIGRRWSVVAVVILEIPVPLAV